VKDVLRRWRPAVTAAPWRLAASAGLYAGAGPPVQYVAENADWVIRWIGERLRDEINTVVPGTMGTTTTPQRLVRRVAHFGSQYMWTAWGPHLARSNRHVVSFFHGKREDGPDVSRHIDEFLASVPRLSRIVTGARMIERRLLAWGVPADKVVQIPIGVDTAVFHPPTAKQRAVARARLAIPEDAVVVGSFQKDGVGWGNGMTPKLIKGPDVLLDVVTRLHRVVPVHVLLTGPARGFVKHGLERAGIPYVHRYTGTPVELVDCYHALDLYLITSREEGGPMALMEGMASGVPVVSTRVGMSPDLLTDGVTGGLAEPADAAGLAERALSILSLTSSDASRLRTLATETVKVCDWKVVARRHLDEVYRPLVADGL
jgi:glycosyltransferase involved in cell wall biosynthesis